MAVRSKRLWLPTAGATLGNVVYTAAALETTLVKQITMFNPALGAQFIGVGINAIGLGSVVINVNVPAGVSADFPGRFIVLQPGDTMWISSTFGTGIVAGFGAELEGVAD